MLKRSWFCECGWTFDEEVGCFDNKEGMEGDSFYYCQGCKRRTRMEWRVIENTDPDDELQPASFLCEYCEEIKPADIKNIHILMDKSVYACDYCLSKPKCEVGQAVLAGGKMGIVDDVEFENAEWTYRVSFNDSDFGWFGDDEIRMSTDFDADMDAQDAKWGRYKI